MIEKIQNKNYRIELGSIEESSFPEMLKTNYSTGKNVIIVDENTHDNCLEYLITTFEELADAEVMLLPAGEENKVMEVCFQVWNALSEYEIGRKDLIINLGGGVVTDMGGFIAAIYKRGVDFIHIPTSLLGMVDASIGGKTGIDLGALKNQLGVFANPQAVFIDPIFLGSLPDEELWNGFAEMLKHALIADQGLWEKLKEIQSIDQLKNMDLIKRCATIKIEIVDQDPKEAGIRKLLNFGHTIGHAIEGFLLENETPIAHGHAVAMGILLESRLSNTRGILSDEEYVQIEKVIHRLYRLIEIESESEVDSIIKLMYNDKKNSEGAIKGILLHSIGVASFDEIYYEEEVRNLLLTIVRR